MPKKIEITTFDSDGYDEMIVDTNISFFSLCEHHLVPFFGTAIIGYIPNGKLIGLSKLSRVVEYYSRQLQMQERMTVQIADFIDKELTPRGVGVILKARHLCREMRGVRNRGEMVTSCLKGIFKIDEKARNEFLSFN